MGLPYNFAKHKSEQLHEVKIRSYRVAYHFLCNLSNTMEEESFVPACITKSKGELIFISRICCAYTIHKSLTFENLGLSISAVTGDQNVTHKGYHHTCKLSSNGSKQS